MSSTVNTILLALLITSSGFTASSGEHNWIFLRKIDDSVQSCTDPYTLNVCINEIELMYDLWLKQ